LAHVSGSWRTRSVSLPANYTRSAIAPRTGSGPDALEVEQETTALMAALDESTRAEIDAINESAGDALLYTDEDAAKEDGYTVGPEIVGEPVEYPDNAPTLFEQVQQSASMPAGLNMTTHMNSFNRKIEQVAAQQHVVPAAQQYPPQSPLAANMPRAIRQRFEAIRNKQRGSGAESN
jgi:hypothetical protein